MPSRCPTLVLAHAVGRLTAFKEHPGAWTLEVDGVRSGTVREDGSAFVVTHGGKTARFPLLRPAVLWLADRIHQADHQRNR